MNRQALSKSNSESKYSGQKRQSRGTTNRYQDTLSAQNVKSNSCQPKSTQQIKEQKKDLRISTSLLPMETSKRQQIVLTNLDSRKNHNFQIVKGCQSTKDADRLSKGNFLLSVEGIHLNGTNPIQEKSKRVSEQYKAGELNKKELKRETDKKTVKSSKTTLCSSSSIQMVSSPQNFPSKNKQTSKIIQVQTNSSEIHTPTSTNHCFDELPTTCQSSRSPISALLIATAYSQTEESQVRSLSTKENISIQRRWNDLINETDNKSNSQKKKSKQYKQQQEEKFKFLTEPNQESQTNLQIQYYSQQIDSNDQHSQNKHLIEENVTSRAEGSLSDSVLASTAPNGSQQQVQGESAWSGTNNNRLLSLTPTGSVQSSNAKLASISTQSKTICKENLNCVESKRESQFSLLDSNRSEKKDLSCEEHTQKIRELKTKYHLRDAIQRQELQKLQNENNSLKIMVQNMEKEISMTRSLRPLEMNHLQRLERELNEEKEKYLCLQSKVVSHSQININLQSIQKTNQCSQNCLDIPINNQTILLKRIEEQDEVIFKLSQELVSVSHIKNEFEECLKNILLKQQLQGVQFQKEIEAKQQQQQYSLDKQAMQRSLILSQDLLLHNSGSLSFEISQYKPSSYIYSSLSESSNILQTAAISSSVTNVQQVLQQNGVNPINSSTGSFFRRGSSRIVGEETEKSKECSPSSSKQLVSHSGTPSATKEGFIFGPPKNVSFYSQEEQLKNPYSKNDKVIFLDTTDKKKDADFQSLQSFEQREQQLNEIQISQQQNEPEWQKQQQEQGKQGLHQQFEQAQNKVEVSVTTLPHNSQQFIYDDKNKEFIINENQLKLLIENYKKAMESGNKI